MFKDSSLLNTPIVKPEIMLVTNNFLYPFREVTENGREYVVVNGVPLVEGVLNGRLVTTDEFGSFVNDWNGVPLVITHPKKNGGSARVPNPDVRVVGRFYNARLDNARLVGEYWLDKEEMLKVPEGEAVLNRILDGQQIETSTGYFSASYKEPGKWNGKDYDLVDRTIHPDHIAILPNEEGACCIKDGCGVNRNAAEIENENTKNCPACINSQDHSEMAFIVNQFVMFVN